MGNHDTTILSVLKASGYEGLSKIADGVVLNILNEIDSSLNIGKLQRIITEIYGEINLLLDPAKRKVLFEYLTEDQARELCDLFGYKIKDGRYWDRLKRIRLNQDRKTLLFDYFNIDYEPHMFNQSRGVRYPAIKTITPMYGLFPHQEDAAAKIKALLKEPRSRVLLHMPTGSGKTRTAMSICSDYIRNHIVNRENRLIFWFADTEELCNQAADEFEAAWHNLGIGETSLYRLYGDVDISLSSLESGFVVAGLQKLNSLIDDEQEGFYAAGKKTNLLIFDEAHKAYADSYSHIIRVFQTTGTASLLGLSATPGRSTFNEEENIRFAKFFRYNKVELEVKGYGNPVDFLQENGYLAKVNYHPLPYNPDEVKLTKKDLLTLASGGDVPPSLLKSLGLDARRNILILNKVLELSNEPRKIILFACSVENANALYALIKYKDISVGLITSDTDSSVRYDFISRYKDGDIQVLVNYGVLTTGFDAPKTNTAIIARPTNSLSLFSQMVGRATRGVRAGGNEECDIFVINDKLKGLRDMSKAFEYWNDAWIEEE